MMSFLEEENLTRNLSKAVNITSHVKVGLTINSR